MDAVTVTLIFLIAVAFAFDFMNGLHDAANSIATIVSTRALKPQYAVIWAAVFNFAAYFVFGVSVANTVGKGIVDPKLVDDAVVFGALSGAIAWNAITWWGGIPSSSSHALIGGIVGAGVAKAGFGAIVWGGLSKTLYAIVLSPFAGFTLGMLLMLLGSWLFVRANPSFADGFFKKLQFVTAALYSLGHGSNDAQKTAGIISVLLFSHGVYQEFTVPPWVILGCYAMMGIGTMMGGWRIVHTVGSRITKLSPMQGGSASLAGALTLFAATNLGVPVSTTHTITASIIGVGSARRVSAVRWNVATGILYAWIITIPAAAIMAAIFYWIGSRFM
jgi:inorganic phosphate transporter, PiT family